jgi:hypothetical protein
MMNILIIEDERSSADCMKRMIEGMGTEYKIVAEVESNSQVRAFPKERHPDIDLILSDIQLVDGLSFDALAMPPHPFPSSSLPPSTTMRSRPSSSTASTTCLSQSMNRNFEAPWKG